MTRPSTRIRSAAALVAFSALVAFEAAIANHFILPCRDECTNPRWVGTGSLATARERHTATLLPNGKVLVAGGRGSPATAGGSYYENPLIDSAELYDPATGTWSVTGRMIHARVGHTATLLADGRVLVAGGQAPYSPGPYGYTETAEIYDPSTGTWRPTASPNLIRFGHAAVRLHGGRVLVTGGYGDDTVGSAELFDPDTETWSETSDLVDGRFWHTMTLLQDGQVLAARGSDQGDLWYNLTSAEVLDPESGTWNLAPDSTLSSVFHSATLLPDGRVLFAGGYGGGDAHGVVNASSELFEPAGGTRRRAGDLLQRRYDHTAALLPDGSVLIAGGTDLIGTVGGLKYRSLASAERFDPRTGTWSSAGELGVPRSSHTMTLLADGTVLVVGGSIIEPDRPRVALASAERYVGAARFRDAVAPRRIGRPGDAVPASQLFAPAP